MKSGADGDTPALSVVIVAWNGRELLGRCLDALDGCYRELPDPLEVIVVDNASTDGTPDMIAANYPGVRLICNPANLGFAEGCRQGLEHARGKYLLLLNPDCEASPRALLAMMDFLRRFPEVGAVGCRLHHADGTTQRSAYRDPGPAGHLVTHSALSPLLHGVSRIARQWKLLLGVDVEGGESARPPRRCDWLMGACIMVPRAVYEKAGSLDPAYFMYSEDADWCRRIRAAGYAIYYLPGVAMLHRQKQSSSRTREFTYVRLYRSLLMYAQRYCPPGRLRMFRRIVLADMTLRLALFPLLALLWPSEAAMRGEQQRASRKARMIWKKMDPDWDADLPPGARG
jgi:hypothetical protein